MTTERPILLVEDNPDDEALTLRAFSRARIEHPVVVARDGVEALDYLTGEGRWAGDSPPAIPAFVMLDLKLPRIDGLEVLRRIRASERTALLPVVMLTTSRDVQDVQDAYRLGANSYIRKPVDFERFLRTLGDVATYWLNINQSPSTES
ncbi:MAG: response regulator [Zoogloea sp.]|nr:response regulator [Zoogloea sp.]